MAGASVGAGEGDRVLVGCQAVLGSVPLLPLTAVWPRVSQATSLIWRLEIIAATPSTLWEQRRFRDQPSVFHINIGIIYMGLRTTSPPPPPCLPASTVFDLKVE